jgi:UDP-GlcNAc:undecaprenyl-phosphate GlcNAc-1-phosphate transferase
MVFLSTLIASVLLTAISVPFLSRLAQRYNLVDMPDERKLHTQAIPYVGGLAMALGTFVPLLYWCADDHFVRAYLLGSSVLLIFGVIDDYGDLSPRWKLLGQGIAALIAFYWGDVQITHLGLLAPDGFVLPLWCALPLTLLAIVGVTNAINLSDGVDGLAGGISLLFLSFISYLAYSHGNSVIALIGLALCGAIFGFLRYNTYPATIFMGDAGSQLLGYSAITLVLHLTQANDALSPFLPLIILGFPVLDTLTVMTERIRRGSSPFSADNNHFHHILLRLGLQQTESVLVIYSIQVLLIALAFLFRYYSDWLLLGGYLLFSGAVLTVFSFVRRGNRQPQRLKLLVKVKEYLRWLRDETECVKYTFRLLKIGMLGVLLLTVLLAGTIPGNVSLCAAVAITVLTLIYFYAPQLLEGYIRVVLYLLIPVVIYYSEINLEGGVAVISARLYNVLFAILAVLNILVSKITRRKQGFKSTPLDFLILILVLVVPNLPDSDPQDFHLGMIAAKIIVCYFSCEVILAEVRGSFRRVALSTLAALLLLAVKGI